jgi:hypothetical protein
MASMAKTPARTTLASSGCRSVGGSSGDVILLSCPRLGSIVGMGARIKKPVGRPLVAVTVERHLARPCAAQTNHGPRPRPGVEPVFCCRWEPLRSRGPWHRNLLLALCFPKFGERRRINFEPSACASARASFTRPTDRTTDAFQLPSNHITHRRERLRLIRIPLYSWRSRAAASTER